MSIGSEEAFLNQLSKRIAELRKARGFTQERLASEASLDRVAIANIETGKRRPTVTTVYRIAQALRIDVDKFFQGL
ncbi:MAG: putative Transcriptional regulator, family [Candidatus Saccharibacteria bacterium]|nr:putative Transcriptional regulator, family [Candidatus Saccharibacteria bacterium]